MAHSAEEEVARNFICFGRSDAVVVVCDATCLERNLNLVLQTMEISDRVLVCVNLLDEAKRKHISIDLNALSDEAGRPGGRNRGPEEEIPGPVDGSRWMTWWTGRPRSRPLKCSTIL